MTHTSTTHICSFNLGSPKKSLKEGQWFLWEEIPGGRRKGQKCCHWSQGPSHGAAQGILEQASQDRPLRAGASVCV